MTREIIPGGFQITRESFEQVDQLIGSMRRGTREFQSVMDLAAELLAKTTQGIVQMKYRGARISSRSVSGYERSSFGFPIRQITGRTLRWWRARRIAPVVLEGVNEERGAYFVEYGIVRGGQGVSRKPLKLSGIATLRFIQRTRFSQRIMAETFGNLRNNRGHFRSFSARMQGSNLLGVAAPTGNLP